MSLRVTYAGHPPLAQDGELVPPPEAQQAPRLDIQAPQGDTSLYTLLCTDPGTRCLAHLCMRARQSQASANHPTHLQPRVRAADAPDPADPTRREWLHWLVTGAPTGDDAAGTRGTQITSYMGPAPPIGTHRYVFLLHKQPNHEPLQVADPSHGGGDRAHFNSRAFAEAHGLGRPVAVAWFTSRKT